MPAPSASSAAAALLLAQAAIAAAPDTGFDQAFPTRAAPSSSRATIVYRGRDGLHRLVLTRDGERRVRRDTDDRLTTIATRSRDGMSYRLDLFDRARRIHTVVDRDSLYRVGRFSDWLDLAHGLRHPAGAFAVRAVATPAGANSALPCRWFLLTASAVRTTICWSRAEALPIAMLDAGGRPVWQVTAIDHHPVRAGGFVVDAAGYVLADARADISGD